jgi:membrane protease YdiL (CAAX protease family)
LTVSSRVAIVGDRSDVTRAIIWLGALAFAGVVGAISPLTGALMDAVILVRLAVLAKAADRWSDAATVMMLVPLLRLLWVTVPISGVPILDWALFITVPFAIATNLVARSVDETPYDVGLTRPTNMPTELLVVAGMAAAGLALGLVLGSQVAWADGGTSGFPARAVLYALLIAYSEELAFRGVMPTVLERHTPGLGFVLAGAAYLILALGAGSPIWVLITVGLGVSTTLIVRRTGSLWGVIAGHAVFLILLTI